MNIKQAKEEIKHTVQAYLLKDAQGVYRIPAIRQRPILMMGPPGIGKTQIMEQIAGECGIGLVAYTITHHTRQSAVGLPFIKQECFEGKEYSVTEYTMSEIIASVYHRIRDFGQKEGILFIDEINCVSETLTPTMLQFLQCKTFGNQKIPEGWIIVAAGNPPEYNKSVRDFDMVTLDRVRTLDIEADLEVWKPYAREQQIHGAVFSYLELCPRNFYRVEADVDGLQFVTARGWEDLSSLMKLYEELELPVTEELVHEFIRNGEVAQDATAYFDLYRKYREDYGIPEILKGNVKPKVYERLLHADFDEKISVVNLLLDALQLNFADAYREKYVTDAWYQFLKAFHDGDMTSTQYTEMLREKQNAFSLAATQQDGTGSTQTKEERNLQMRILQLLQENAPKDEELSGEALFDLVRSGFAEQKDLLKNVQEKTGKALEHAFDFLEDAFTTGQEMLIFITGLTMGREATSFLTQYDCERYQKYNEELLAGSRRTELLKELSF
ncbi:MAG: AAA family ATPase [Lachnospiraceae bacterium]|nr:AAA family ATPase [Lachnospiraceae bacterium]